MVRLGKYARCGAAVVIGALLMSPSPRRFPVAAPPTCEQNGNCYVAPGGAGLLTGVDWNNAYADFPASPTCGVTYYLAGGSYDYTSKSLSWTTTCTSGTPIVIYKAVSGGPGNPQNAPGWQASYGTSQAIFSQTTDPDPEKHYSQFISISGNGYVTIDGVTPVSGTPTSGAAFGIVLRSANNVQFSFIDVHAPNVTIKHIEEDGTTTYEFGVPITSCSGNGTTETVNLASSISGIWANGDIIDIYLDILHPNPIPPLAPRAVPVTIVSGTQITVPNINSGTCTIDNGSVAILDFTPGGSFYLRPPSAPSNVVISDNFIHNVGASMSMISCDTCSILRNYITGDWSSPTQHENAIDGPVLTNSAIAQNIFQDINGTGFIITTGNDFGWQNDSIYSNLFFCSQAADTNGSTPTASPQCNVSAFLSDDNGANAMTNILVYGNTFVARSATEACKIQYIKGSTTTTVENNLIYCPALTLVLSAPTHDYNTAFTLSNNNAAAPNTHDFYYCWPSGFPCVNSGNYIAYHFADPFANDADSAMNFQLASETVDPHLNDGVTLSTPYNLDLLGATRGADGTWERGAYEFNTGAPPAKPNPPTNLGVTGVH